MNQATHFHGDDVKPSLPEDALFHVIPVPYEETVSYGTGTALGPQAILDASCQLELFDGKSVPANKGIYTSTLVDCTGSVTDVLQRITTEVDRTLGHNKIPVVLGGEHTITLGTVTGLEQKYKSFGIIQFDAHADLRDSYQGTGYSHACVMKRIHDKKIPIFQLGTRSYSHEEHILRHQDNIAFLDAEEIHLHGIKRFTLPDNFPDKVFITFDIDSLDPSVMPATGTPVPGGLSWYQSMWLLEKIMQTRTCIGFDVVEFAPLPYLHAASFTAAQLVYNIMGFITRSKASKGISSDLH